jgi:hypothetical protein
MLDVWNRCCVHFVGLTASFVAFSTLIWVGISLLLSRWMRWPLSTLEQKSIPVTKISRFPSSIYFQIWVGSFFLSCFVKQARRASKLQPQTTTKQSSNQASSTHYSSDTDPISEFHYGTTRHDTTRYYGRNIRGSPTRTNEWMKECLS